MTYSRRIQQRITRTGTGHRRVQWAEVDFDALTQVQLAAMFGVAGRTIQYWGPPRNEDGTYCAAAVIRWYNQNADSSGKVYRD